MARERRKRGHGEGSVYQRESDGRWVGQVTVPNGKPKYLYGKTRREAADKMTAALREVQQGKPLPNGKQTVAGFLTYWLEDVARQSARPGTYRSYETLVRLHIVPAIGRIPLAQLSAQQVQHMLTEKAKAGMSARRRQMIRAVLRAALSQALKWRLVTFNAAADAAPVRVEKKDVPVLTPDDATALVAAIKGDPLEALYISALASGLRQGELLGMRWSDVNFDSETFAVRHQLQRVAGKWQLTEPKSSKARRTLAVDPMVIDALRAHKVRQIEQRLVAGSRWQETIPDLVFRNSVGNPLDASTVTHRFQRSLRQAGLPRMRFHDLRHGAASLLLSQGVDLRTIMDQLGHSQISLTMNTYAHVAPALQRDAAKRLGAILSGTR